VGIDGKWHEAVPISPANTAPPGASVVTGFQTSKQIDLFFIGKNGALNVAWASAESSGASGWNGPIEISPPGNALPGGGLVAANQTSFDQLDVFFIGANNGALRVAWVAGLGKWQGPIDISPPDTAPPGADLAAVYQGTNQLDVFFIGNNGALKVAWVVGLGKWQGPIDISPPDMAPKGAGLYAHPQGANQIDVFFIGNDGAFKVAWVAGLGKWQGPIKISGPNIASPGADLAAAYIFSKNKKTINLSVFVNGFERWVFSVDGLGQWQGPLGRPNN
jgi:hypothetical protein